jgi:hypothetical protein
MMKPYIAAAAFICCTAILSCGGAVKSAQGFIPNNAPVVAVFTAEYAGNDSANYSSTALCNGMPFLITVEAEDPEGGELTYTLTSAFGSFGTKTVTEKGITRKLYTKNIVGSTEATVTLTVTDAKNARYTKTIPLGSGKARPGLTTWGLGSDSLTPSDTTNFYFRADCTGSYRVYVDNAITDKEDAVIGTSVTLYNTKDAEVKVTLAGPGANAPANAVSLSTGVNRVWLVFQDALKQNTPEGYVINVNGETPYVVSTAPGKNEKNVDCGAPISAQFSKSLNIGTITASSVYLSDASNVRVDGAFSYEDTTKTVTFTPAAALAYNSVYTMTLTAAITDTVGTGNAMLSQFSFSFTTAAENTVVNPAFSPIPGMYPDAKTVSLSCATAGAAIIYTLNGSDPEVTVNNDGSYSVKTGTPYTAALDVAADTTVKALAYKNNFTASNIVTGTYSIRVKPPVIDDSGLDSLGAGTITMTSATSGATVYYTLDGTDPSGFGKALGSSQTIAIEKNITVRAVAKLSGMTDSAETEKYYPVHAAAPAFSITPAVTTLKAPATLYLSSTAGATIYYTLNTAGGAPADPTDADASPTEYVSGIDLSQLGSAATVWSIKAYAKKDGLIQSGVSAAVYTMNYGSVGSIVFTPSQNPADQSTVYTSTQYVTVESKDTADADIDCYSTAAPDTHYRGTGWVVVPVTASATLHATASKPNLEPVEASQWYTIKTPAPVISATTPDAIIVGNKDHPFTTNQTVTISCPIPDAPISLSVTGYIDGNPENGTPGNTAPSPFPDPVTSPYPINLGRSLAISATAEYAPMDESDSAEAVYYMKTATPVLSLPSCTKDNPYLEEKTSVASCATDDAALSYTAYIDNTNGSDLSSAQSPVSNPSFPFSIPVGKSMKIVAQASKEGCLPADSSAMGVYYLKVKPPVVTGDSSSTYYSMSCETPGTEIHYNASNDGNTVGTPDTLAAKYTSLISLGSAYSIKARAFRTGWLPSEPEVNRYRILVPFTESGKTGFLHMEVSAMTGTLVAPPYTVYTEEAGSANISDAMIDASGQYILAAQGKNAATNVQRYLISFNNNNNNPNYQDSTTVYSSFNTPMLGSRPNASSLYMSLKIGSPLCNALTALTASSNGVTFPGYRRFNKSCDHTIYPAPAGYSLDAESGKGSPFVTVCLSNLIYYLEVYKCPSSWSSSANIENSEAAITPASTTVSSTPFSCVEFHPNSSTPYMYYTTGGNVYSSKLNSDSTLGSTVSTAFTGAESLAVLTTTAGKTFLFAGSNSDTQLKVADITNGPISSLNQAASTTDPGLDPTSSFRNLSVGPNGRTLFATVQYNAGFYLCSFTIDPSSGGAVLTKALGIAGTPMRTIPAIP